MEPYDILQSMHERMFGSYLGEQAWYTTKKEQQLSVRGAKKKLKR